MDKLNAPIRTLKYRECSLLYFVKTCLHKNILEVQRSADKCGEKVEDSTIRNTEGVVVKISKAPYKENKV